MNQSEFEAISWSRRQAREIVLVLPLIGGENGASFADQSQGEV